MIAVYTRTWSIIIFDEPCCSLPAFETSDTNAVIQLKAKTSAILVASGEEKTRKVSRGDDGPPYG